MPKRLSLKTAAKYLLILVFMVGGCSADFHSKKWAESTLKGRPPTTVVRGLLEFGFVENRGMIFGILNRTMPEAGKKILTGFRILILVLLTGFMLTYRSRGVLFHLPFVLIWAGALGNLIDPFVYGYVVDFIHLQAGSVLNWPFFFNLADAYVTIGIAFLLVFNPYIKREIIRTL
jgi:signal peptidase II